MYSSFSKYMLCSYKSCIERKKASHTKSKFMFGYKMHNQQTLFLHYAITLENNNCCSAIHDLVWMIHSVIKIHLTKYYLFYNFDIMNNIFWNLVSFEILIKISLKILLILLRVLWSYCEVLFKRMNNVYSHISTS